MGSFELLWRASTRKDLRKIPSADVTKIIAAVEDLSRDPFPSGCQKLSGVERTYRIRVGDYRAVYIVDSQRKTVEVVRVRNRRDVYRD